MATIDNWKMGFCANGGMDVSVNENVIITANRVKIRQHVCSNADMCKLNGKCEYSNETCGPEEFSPVLIMK